MTAYYSHSVEHSDIYVISLQSFYGGHSGCIESTNQPSPMKKSCRTTLQYVIQNDGARDLVIPPG